MENRIGTAIILIESTENIQKLNQILSLHSGIIIGRQGIPMHNRGINLISIIFEGTTDEIGSMTGKIGRLNGVKIKSAVLSKEN